MAQRVTTAREAFLATLIERHRTHLQRDQAYEAMMYAAREPPTRASLEHLIDFTSDERGRLQETLSTTVHVPDEATRTRLAQILGQMQWPDPEPLHAVARLLPGWDTLHVSTLLHTSIPDYPIFGASESAGLDRLGDDVPYDPDPDGASALYGRYIDAVKTLREEARFDQVPESHHYLTRIVQSALADLVNA